ncbi:MAG TPA: DUF6683 family protein [Pyrinomonadaceae bacterium]|nr:DUF6683 family protein [Pyrinomonadaceae bacterium]
MRYGLITLAAASLLLFAGAEAAAQSDAYMRLMRTQNQQMMNRVRAYSTVRSGARITRYGGAGKSAGGGTTSPGKARPAPAPPAGGGPGSPPAGSTSFRPVAPSIMPREMAEDLATTPAERARLEKMFSDLLENYRNRLRQAGGPQTDVARAASFLISASRSVYFDTQPMSMAQINALREHIREVFASDEKFQRASDRERQKMFETYAIVGAFIDAGFHIVKQAGDREGMRQWHEMARANFENMLGAPPEKVDFTLNGVEYR